MAVSNAVGPSASNYFKHLEKFLYRIPSNIMGLPIFQLIKITDSNEESSKVKDKKFLGKQYTTEYSSILNLLRFFKNLIDRDFIEYIINYRNKKLIYL